MLGRELRNSLAVEEGKDVRKRQQRIGAAGDRTGKCWCDGFFFAGLGRHKDQP